MSARSCLDGEAIRVEISMSCPMATRDLVRADAEELTVMLKASAAAETARCDNFILALFVHHADNFEQRSRREVTPGIKRERSPNPPRERRPKASPPKVVKEEAAVHSGSEEGEIEEE